MKNKFTLFLLVLFACLLPTNLYAQRMGFLIEEVDGTPSGYAYKIKVSNGSFTDLTGAVATVSTSGSGQAITLDLGDDAGNDSIDLGEIATTGDTNSIFTEPTADKLLIAVGNNWPTADTANAGDSATAFFSAGTIEAARLPVASDTTAGIAPTTAAAADGEVLTVQADLSIAWEAGGGGTGDVTGVGDCASGACLDGSSDGGSYIRVYDGDSHYGEFQVPDVAGNVTYTFPAATATLIADTGSANIVTVGTIGTGTWQGTAVDEAYVGANLDAANFAATLTFADGDLINFAGITHTGATDEGVVLPTWADVVPSTNQAYIAWDGTGNALKIYDGGWLTFATAAAPLDAKYIVQQADATLAEQSLGALASGILYSTTTTGVVSIATEAQMETTLGIGFGASKAATAGYILVMDGTDLESVAMSGDVTIAAGGAATVADDSHAHVVGNIDSANSAAWAGQVSDETGTGLMTFATAPTFTTSIAFNAVTDTVAGVQNQNLVDKTAAEEISGAWEVQDDTTFAFGDGADWTIEYDEGVDDQLLFLTAGTAATATTDPMFEIIVGATPTADQQVFGIAKGTQVSNTSLFTVDEDGDITFAGTMTGSGAGDSYLQLTSNASLDPVANRLYVEANEWKMSEDGVESSIVSEGDSATITGTTWSFAGVTNMVLPTTAADASGEISISAGNQLIWHDGTKAVAIDTTVTTDNYILKYDNASATFNLEADETGGTPAWESVTDPTADQTLTHPLNVETAFEFTSTAYQAPMFLITQHTGAVAAAEILFEVRAADSDVTVMEVGDGTNVWTVSVAGQLANAGTADLNLAAATDLLVGGAQIDYDDMAGSAAISTSSTAATGVLTVTGLMNTSVGLDAVGAVDLDYGSADVTDHTFVSDGGTVVIDGTIATPGAITGLTSRGADITTPTNHDTTETHNVVYVFTAVATVTLDAAADAGYGATVCYRVRDAEVATIDVDGAEKINLEGTALAVGFTIDSSGAAGEFVCLMATTDSDGTGTDGWETWGLKGTWADGGAT